MLRAAALGVVVFALVAALWGYFGRGNDQTVPSQVRSAMVERYPGMAFVPGRLPSGYAYANWEYSKRRGYAYALIFFLHGSVTHQIDLSVGRHSCPAPPKWPAKDTHTLHANGHALKWLRSSNGPIVWRCMTNRGRSFVIFGLSQTARPQDLAELVGYALPAH